MNYDWTLVAHETLFEKYFKLDEYSISHELYAGGQSQVFTREIFERGAVVALLPYDPIRRKLVLIEQFRIGAINDPEGPWLLECVAGVMEKDETEESVARRETIEEAGCEVKRLHPLLSYYVSPGGTTELCSLFCGIIDSDGVGGIHGLADENEDIRVLVVDVDTALDWLNHGRIKSSATIIALQWLALHESSLRERDGA